MPLAFVPSSNVQTTQFVVPTGLIGPGEAAVFWTQGLFLESTGRALLGPPLTWIVLDESHDPDDGC